MPPVSVYPDPVGESVGPLTLLSLLRPTSAYVRAWQAEPIPYLLG